MLAGAGGAAVFAAAAVIISNSFSDTLAEPRCDTIDPMTRAYDSIAEGYVSIFHESGATSCRCLSPKSGAR